MAKAPDIVRASSSKDARIFLIEEAMDLRDNQQQSIRSRGQWWRSASYCGLCVCCMAAGVIAGGAWPEMGMTHGLSFACGIVFGVAGSVIVATVWILNNVQ